jgi:hypothetical protein
MGRAEGEGHERRAGPVRHGISAEGPQWLHRRPEKPRFEPLPTVAVGVSVRYRTPVMTGTVRFACTFLTRMRTRRSSMNAIIYLVGLVVVVMFILSLVGLR